MLRSSNIMHPAFMVPPSPCRSTRQWSNYNLISSSFKVNPVGSSISVSTLNLSPLLEVPPFETPLVVLGALLLAFSAQSWINSLLGGDQGLGAFLSDGTGFNKSSFKQRKRPITDERSLPRDPSAPLGAGDPLPWLKLPELDYVDVAGQPKKSPKPKVKQSQYHRKLKKDRINRDELVLLRLEALKDEMKTAVQSGELDEAKRIEDELEKLMKEEGYDFSA